MNTKQSKIRIIALDGHDRSGKDEIMNKLDFNDFLVYKQPETEAQDTDYKNPEKFKQFMLKYIRKVLDDLYTMSTLNGTDRPIVMSRLLLCDNVFSDIYGREHVVEKYFGNEINTNFNITNYIMLFKDYEEYRKRIEIINGTLDFNKDELDNITKLYYHYKNDNDIVKLISASDSKEKEYNDFVSTFIMETPKWKLEHGKVQ